MCVRVWRERLRCVLREPLLFVLDMDFCPHK